MRFELFDSVGIPFAIESVSFSSVKLGLGVERTAAVPALLEAFFFAVDVVQEEARFLVGKPAGEGAFEQVLIVSRFERFLVALGPFDVLAVSLAVLELGLLQLVAVRKIAGF